MEYALQVKNLSKRIKNNKILSDVNIDIKCGEAAGLIGPNGAGKTSLIKCIAGLWHADIGDISICDNDINTHFEKAMESAGFLIEYPKLFGQLTLVQNIEYISSYYNVIATKKDIFKLIALVGLEKRMFSKLKTFSSGMYQRICLATLLLRKPSILILDEPTATLDPKSVIDFRNILINIKQECGVSMLISSHNLTEIEKLCDRVIIIDKGVVVNDKEIKISGEKRYKIFFSDTETASKAATLLHSGVTYSLDNNLINIICTIDQFKRFISECTYDIKDIKTGDLESEFLSAIEGENK